MICNKKEYYNKKRQTKQLHIQKRLTQDTGVSIVKVMFLGLLSLAMLGVIMLIVAYIANLG